MTTYTKDYPERSIRIIVNDYVPNDENSKTVVDILGEGKPGIYIVTHVPTPSVIHQPYTPANPYNPGSMFIDPSYFKRDDPNHPFKKYDPDNDELQPPGGPSANYFI
ncbi:hypothetical protein NEDG_01396 [Nematocida displodere]|uniref:Uncharacterized protein n=1 Tax=Nematocida displodere TaxID=1805483 RepID=A0A177EBJ3_9MICR|nr:hypothetical protein NEDG_01396 [Nematocida displodere]